MRHPSIQTVDISAKAVSSFAPPVTVARPRHLGTVIRQSLGIDIFLVFVSLLMGLLFSSAIGEVISPAGLERSLLLPPQWLAFAACALPPVLCLFVDALSALSNPAALPFARSKQALNAIYAGRLHLMLLAFYFTAILAALCWSALTMALSSKLFVAAIFAFALYALGQSIPSRRTSFIVSGILFLVVLVATQAFMVMRLDANAEKDNQEALELVPSAQDKAPSVFDEAETLP